MAAERHGTAGRLRGTVRRGGIAVLLICAGAGAGAPLPAAADANQASQTQDSLAQHVQPCTACHGAQGHATSQGYYPRIAGKPAGYLFDQLLNFRAGRRHFPAMVYFTQLQDPAYLREMAGYFAAQRVPYPAPEPPRADAASLARGGQLAQQGDAKRGVPACAACHGTRLLGVEPAVPGLLGVSQDYLLGQLGAWRSGARAAFAPDCMATVARRLTPAEVNAVTAWLASQSAPDGAGPDAAFLHPPPLACGSLTQATADRATSAQRPDAALIERGRELVVLGDCEACHTARGGAAFAGGRAIPTPFGTFYSPNITPDAATGIGRWSAADFWRALHQGYSRDGRPLYPTFPYTNYTRIARSDVDAMYAYLRTVPPVSQPSRPHELRLPYAIRPLLAAWRLLYFRPGVYQPDVRRSAQWNRGAYLVQGLGHCSACHEARNSLGASRSQGNPPGGLALSWYAPSLSRPDQAGLQDWRIADIQTLLGSGVVGSDSSPPPHAVTLGPMAEVVYSSLQYVSAADLQAMAAYLQSLPRGEDQAAGPAARAPDQVLYDGQALYGHDCASCHGESGMGRGPLGPPLAGNRALTMATSVDPIRIVLFGGFPPGTRTDPRPYGMPPFAQSLDDDQIAAVLSYVRAAWGNSAGPVDSADVGRNRGNPLW